MLTVQCFTFNPVGENTYILYNEKRDCCIIDPGCYFASEEIELKAFIENHNLQPLYLLQTHCHFDHIFGSYFVHKTFGLEMHLHPQEQPVWERGASSAENWGLRFQNYDGPVHYLNEGDVVRLGDDELEVLFTPGHSPGSISFYSKENKLVVSGDVLFNGSVGRTDLPGGDFSVLEQSILTKLYTLPGDTIVYSGHGATTTIGDEMKTNPFVKMI